jgi:hypothetical protein
LAILAYYFLAFFLLTAVSVPLYLSLYFSKGIGLEFQLKKSFLEKPSISLSNVLNTNFL